MDILNNKDWQNRTRELFKRVAEIEKDIPDLKCLITLNDLTQHIMDLEEIIIQQQEIIRKKK